VPDYKALINFLLKPLLKHPDALRVDFESSRSDRLWVRVAFDPEDRGIVFGKGERTVQAVRTVIMATAQDAGQNVRLEVFDPTPNVDRDEHQAPPTEVGDRPRIQVERPKRREVIQ
jgi:hypothetical protein